MQGKTCDPSSSPCHLRELQSEYFHVSPEQLGFQYKKAVFLEYTDATFTAKKTSDGTLQGPLLKGEVNDQVHVRRTF